MWWGAFLWLGVDSSAVGLAMVCGMRGYELQRYGAEVWVVVYWEDDAIIDRIKGLNRGHALWRARWNWPTAELITVIG